MRSPISYGFLRPKASRVRAGAWRVTPYGQEELLDPESLPNWDYFTDIQVAQTLQVQLAGIREDCRLSPTSTIKGLVLWHSQWTGLRGASSPQILREGSNDLETLVPAHLVGGRLTIESRIVLGQAVAPLDVLAPHRPGSTLLALIHRIALEGAGTRFPIVQIPFSTSGIAGGRGAAWMLDIDIADLGSSGSGSVRLFLNSEHASIVALLTKPDSAQSKSLHQFLHLDVARQMFIAAMTSSELTESTSYEEDSLGEMLINTVDRLFPDRELKALQGDYKVSPGEVEAELQARVGFAI